MAQVMKLIGPLRMKPFSAPSSPSISPNFLAISNRFYARRAKASSSEESFDEAVVTDVVPERSGSRRTVSEILNELGKRVPESVIRTRVEDGFASKYIPWHLVNRTMNLHAPEWSGEVRNITYSADGKTVSVVYRVTIYGADTEVYRESTGTASVANTGYGDPVQTAEAMAFRRACARFGLGLHLYHEEL